MMTLILDAYRILQARRHQVLYVMELKWSMNTLLHTKGVGEEPWVDDLEEPCNQIHAMADNES